MKTVFFDYNFPSICQAPLQLQARCVQEGIIENLSGITAGSPMVGTPIILVRRPINPGLIIDPWINIII